jgi:hypothetical protein
MAFLYTIHDAFYPGCSDGDVDDRAAIQLYDKYLCDHPNDYIIVYLTGESRFKNATKYLNQQTNTGKRIVYTDKYNPYEAKYAKNILICAPIPDPSVRADLSAIITLNQNGYCQGDKIGVTNFPKAEYKELLDSIPERNRFSTQQTSIAFPVHLLDYLDFENKDEYLSYGLFKLFAIGGIIHIPSLVYRLYCPEIGGGPGTNMLKIQELIQKHLIPMMEKGDYNQELVSDLKKLIVYSGNFEEFNDLLIQIVYHKEIYMNSNFNLVNEFMIQFRKEMPDANHKAMENALKVMIYFARMIYVKYDADLLFDHNTTKFYSLSEIPEGKLMIELDESPPLYDFVFAYLVLNGYNNIAYFLCDKSLTRDKIILNLINKL